MCRFVQSRRHQIRYFGHSIFNEHRIFESLFTRPYLSSESIICTIFSHWTESNRTESNRTANRFIENRLLLTFKGQAPLYVLPLWIQYVRIRLSVQCANACSIDAFPTMTWDQCTYYRFSPQKRALRNQLHVYSKSPDDWHLEQHSLETKA